MASQVMSPTGVAGVQPVGAQTNPPGKGLRPFRQAALLKRATGTTDTLAAITIAAQPLGNRVIEGSGFLRYVDLDIVATAAGNAAAVAYAGDAPWSALQSVVFQATGTDIINLTGYSLYLCNLYGGFGLVDPAVSLDPTVYNLVAGAGATGGSFRARLRVPLAINDRSLMGFLGNQSQATKYEMPLVMAPDAAIYTVNPTALPPIQVTRNLGFCTVPAPVDGYGMRQEQVPGHYTVVHTMFQVQSEAAATTGAARVNHYLRGIGNTMRYTIVVFRNAAGARVDAMLPVDIGLYIGEDPIFTESSADRRQIMHDQFGFDSPPGVLVYTWDDDFNARAGFGLGDDFIDSKNITNMQFRFSYPAFGGGPGTVTFIHDQLVVPETIDFRAFM